MALPTSGKISMQDIADEINSGTPGTIGSTNISLAGGTTPQAGSLFGEANNTVNKIAPHAISEFYGYEEITTPTPSNTPTPTPTPSNTPTQTPTPSNTPTRTPTPTPTPEFQSHASPGNGLSDANKGDACNAFVSVDIYTSDSTTVAGLQIGHTMYTDSAKTSVWVGQNEWYGLRDDAGGTSTRVVEIDNNGVIQDIINCAVTPTSTQTPTPTPTPVTQTPTPTNTPTNSPTPSNTPTQTPTPTPTPTNTPVFQSTHTQGNGLSDLDKEDACSSFTTVDIYTRDATTVAGLSTGDTMYGSSNTIFANRWVGGNLWYGLNDTGGISTRVVQIDNNGVIQDIIECTVTPTPTQTPTNSPTPSNTPTPTPTNTPVFQSTQTAGNGASDGDKEDECNAFTSVDIYTRDSVNVAGLQVGDTMYASSNTIFANRWIGGNLWYGVSDTAGFADRVIEIDNNGVIQDIIECSATTPTQTPTPTNTPTPSVTPSATSLSVTAYSSSVQSNFINVCSETINQTYYHDGIGSTPTFNDTVYSNTSGTFLPSGYYRIAVDTYIVVGSNGNVDSVDPCL